MLYLTLKISNKLGLHARASAKFVSTTGRFQSAIHIIKDHKKINGKSIMAVMALAAKKGTELQLEIDGPDQEDMATAITTLVTNNFGEAE